MGRERSADLAVIQIFCRRKAWIRRRTSQLQQGVGLESLHGAESMRNVVAKSKNEVLKREICRKKIVVQKSCKDSTKTEEWRKRSYNSVSYCSDFDEVGLYRWSLKSCKSVRFRSCKQQNCSMSQCHTALKRRSRVIVSDLADTRARYLWWVIQRALMTFIQDEALCDMAWGARERPLQGCPALAEWVAYLTGMEISILSSFFKSIGIFLSFLRSGWPSTLVSIVT